MQSIFSEEVNRNTTKSVDETQTQQQYPFLSQEDTQDYQQNKSFEQQTQYFKPFEGIFILYCANLQTVDLSFFDEKARCKEKQRDIKNNLLNIDYFSFKFKEIDEQLENSKGGYGSIDVVKDQKDRLLIRKRVKNEKVFQNELQFFQEMNNQYLVDIYYYSQSELELYLEKGDLSLYTFIMKTQINNRFFLFLLCLSIVEAVKSLHISNIFHGDIKPHNIILFYKEGFNIDNLQNDQKIDIKEIEQFLVIESFINFDFKEFVSDESKIYQDEINIDFSDFFNALYYLKQKNKQIQRNYQSFSEMLEKLFSIAIKFIDFQSSSHLNKSSKISFYTKGFTSKIFLDKYKDKFLSLQDKVYLDHYSTFRTLLMISNPQHKQNFCHQDDSCSIHQTQNKILRSLLESYLCSIDKYFNEEQSNYRRKYNISIQLPLNQAINNSS